MQTKEIVIWFETTVTTMLKQSISSVHRADRIQSECGWSMCLYPEYTCDDHDCSVCGRPDSDYGTQEKEKKSLADWFMMKNMGKLHYCLGVSVIQDEENASEAVRSEHDQEIWANWSKDQLRSQCQTGKGRWYQQRSWFDHLSVNG